MKLGRKMTVIALLCLAGGLLFLMPEVALAAPAGDALESVGRSPEARLLGLLLLGGLTLPELRQQRQAKLDEMDAITRADLTDETRARFDALDKEVQALDGDIARHSRAEEARRSAAERQAPPSPTLAAAEPRAVPATAAESRDLGWEFGAFVRSYAMSQYQLRAEGRIAPASGIAKDLYGERHPVTEAVTRAQSLNDNAGGGFLVAPHYASEIIRLFGPAAIVRRRARTVPGNASYPKGKSGASVGYVGEMEQGNVTGVTFGMIDMTEKDIAAILPISKKLLRHTAIGVESYCRDELGRAAIEFEDRKFFYGTGTGKEVKGYKHSIPAAGHFAVPNNAAPTAADVRKELRKPLKYLAEQNVDLRGMNPAWQMHPSARMYLEDLYQGDVKAFPTLEGENPMLMGYPVDCSTQIIGPAGTGGDIFFGAHQHAMIADTVSMTLSTSDQASFKNAAGEQVNMWAQGLMAIKLDMSHDFALRYEQAFTMLEGVRWGA